MTTFYIMHNRKGESSLLTMQCLALITAASVLLLGIGVHSQITPINHGCSFTDNEHVYNVQLAPGEHHLPCPDSEAVKEHLKVTSLSSVSFITGYVTS